MARPAIGHGAFADELSYPNLSKHVELHNNVGNRLPATGMGSTSWSTAKETPEAVINREFEPGLSLGNSICSEIPPHDHHSKYSPCY